MINCHRLNVCDLVSDWKNKRSTDPGLLCPGHIIVEPIGVFLFFVRHLDKTGISNYHVVSFQGLEPWATEKTGRDEIGREAREG